MRVKIWLRRSLLIAGLALLGAYAVIWIDGTLQSRARLREFDQRRQEYQQATLSDRPQAVDFRLWSPKRVQAYRASLETNVVSTLAVLRIPKIELEVPVLEGTDDLSLNRGVGWIAGTARPDQHGNVGIAGHRDGFFRGLKDISVGDKLELQTVASTEEYIVDEIEIVSPQDSSVLRPRPQTSLTLVTCYPFYFVGSAPQRYIVHAVLANGTRTAQSETKAAGGSLGTNRPRARN